MDPAANLTEQRELAAKILEAWEELAGYSHRLAELVQALDEWRQKGGFDPYLASPGSALPHPTPPHRA